MHKPLAIAFAVLAASIAGASAQTYPDRSIKVVVPYPAGGPTDTVARTVTQGLAVDLGQSVIIENQAGAGGRVAMKAVARAVPDGYTLLVGGTNNNAITPALYKDLDFDPVKDFAPVAALASDSLVLVVHPSVPATTLAELVRYAKDNPGKLSSGGGVGIAPHFLLEFIRVRSGTKIVFVPYKGAAPATTDTLAGQIQLHTTAKSTLLPLILSRPAARARGDERRALARASGGADPARGRLRRLPDGDLVRPAGAGGDAGAGRRQAQCGGQSAAQIPRNADRVRKARPRPTRARAAGIRRRAGRAAARVGGGRAADRRQAGVKSGMPKEIVARLNAEIGRILLLPEVKKRMADIAVETAGSSPEELATLTRADADKWGRIIKQLGITPQ